MNLKTGITLEVDYYGRCDDGVRYHVKTTRITLPATPQGARIESLPGGWEAHLPFLLTGAVGDHHGIIRVREVA